MHNLLLVFAALILVAANGFFVAAEFGLVRLRSTRVAALATELGWRGRVLRRVHGQLDAYLSACQLGITLASLGLGWIGEPAFARLLEPLFALAGVDNVALVSAVSFVVAFGIISFLHIVIGELAPKSIALRMPELVSGWTAWPLYGFYWLALPAIALLNWSSNAVLRLTGLGATAHDDAVYSADELKLILRTTRVSKNMTRKELDILAHSMDFSELEVSDLMRPIGEVVAMSSASSVAENLAIARTGRFTRYPYFDAEGEGVLGIINLKDLFLATQDGRAIDSLEPFLRPVTYVPPKMPALELFRQFRAGAPHLAVVGHLNELQPGSRVKPVGFITLDNLLTALVGEIQDEFGAHGDEWTLLPDGSMIGKGSLPLFTLERALGVEMPTDAVDSIGGLISWKLSDLPSEGQRVPFDGFQAVVERMRGPRITTVRIIPQAAEAPVE
ncbi:hemolysin family protein [Chitinasiproducens palmae]|uniref:Hemolysin, contains CBS domains n=1 Tax=Chitinasiproducens palmae TaxID=1770053 RepID=A0A1H2PSC6_9BURK|nr:hemolysin family protein [Chitinasiproducens palmae]SDV49848.1 Hemolysin, contains CBS domains [Chitinasiproducens palmae]